MLRQYARLVGAGLRLLDYACLVLAMPVALALHPPLPGEEFSQSLGTLAALVVLVMLAWTAATWSYRVYDTYRTRPLAIELGRITRALLWSALLATAADFLLWRFEAPRLLLVLYFGLALLSLLACRLVLRRTARSARRHGYNARRYAVVGSGELADEVARTMASHPEWGYELAGLIVERGAEVHEKAPVLGCLDEMGALLERHVLDQVIFALPSCRLAVAEEAARACQEQGVPVMICLDLLHGGLGQMALSRLDGVPALTFTTVPTDALALAAKRAFDILVSAAVLLLVAPVLACVAVAIKLESPGPVLFRQRRVGLNGREFSLLKFRSMNQGAEAQQAALRALNEASGPVFKMTHDPRVTRIGQLIRKASLDEFPQFWNVLRGEMSVVGPRPPIPSEVVQYKRWQRRRLSVKPGITCTWQISGRNDIDFEQWMALDLEYIDNWSLGRDLVIVLKTIPAVLSARGVR